MTRVQIKPELLRWACERSRMDALDLRARFPHVDGWVRGESQPTFKQVESFAKATHTPIGFLFLAEPPVELIPIPDFRKVKGTPLARPSADLLETIYAMQRRQDWLREDRIESESAPLEFVASARLQDDPVGVGKEIRRAAGLADGWAREVRTWQEAVKFDLAGSP
jgi:hypothetical protein